MSAQSHSESPDELPSCPLGFGGSSPLINPRNMMPVISQSPSADQSTPLSTERVTSTIPIADSKTSRFWEYPSPQQFYNALRRRDKSPEADSMDAVVFVHNYVNEVTWKKVIEWEAAAGCSSPSLKRFVGKSEEISPLARIKSLWLGKPFDRHDWFVDRCGSKQVRYVIDYYDAPSSDGLDVVIHVRPALDGLSGIYERLKGFFRHSND